MVFFVFLMGFCTLVFHRINRAHKEQFRRADYYNGSNNWSLTYSDFSLEYPRETLDIPSGKYLLNGFLYGMENKNGLIIISSGHRNCTEVNLS
ncbi:MAG: dipeptidyl aminopeptidase/acylaminoacyl-peptidase-like protein, partial [Lachnospiraceae bacterium]|nr:dipeptidyl aminopeptidase/acylaminoacyl-peptidase-like protein [Lachnospiraceae bacterium]